MPRRVIEQLRALDVNRLGIGYHLDGRGLYLQVTASSRSWVFRFKSPIHGRVRDMGLGATHAISLSKARDLASEARAAVLAGTDPLDVRENLRVKARFESANAVTFKKAARDYIDSVRATWKNPKHALQWDTTLEAYVYPIFGDIAVAAVDATHIIKALRPIWHTKPETASRIRGRIENILESAKTLGQRTGENPAALRGVVSALGKQMSKQVRVKHRPALAFDEVADFMRALAELDGTAPRALEFTILTAARSREVMLATWDEIDIDAAVWTVPAERMKAKRIHRVTLNQPAVTLLKNMQAVCDPESKFVFPGGRAGKPLSENAMLQVLERVGREDVTVHGFRSTFKDWAAERTNFDNIVSEAALAHVVGDKKDVTLRAIFCRA